jgi:flagellar biosynthesis/type III secretory pathway protein FliH
VVEEIMTALMPQQEEPKRNLLILTYAFASLAFEQDEEQLNWLYRRFAMIDDSIRETPAYKVLTKEAHEEGVQQGLEQGLEQARQRELQRLRHLLQDIVKARFPKLARLAKKQ